MPGIKEMIEHIQEGDAQLEEAKPLDEKILDGTDEYLDWELVKLWIIEQLKEGRNK